MVGPPSTEITRILKDLISLITVIAGRRLDSIPQDILHNGVRIPNYLARLPLYRPTSIAGKVSFSVQRFHLMD